VPPDLVDAGVDSRERRERPGEEEEGDEDESEHRDIMRSLGD
jgi:hypothetical protein